MYTTTHTKFYVLHIWTRIVDNSLWKIMDFFLLLLKNRQCQVEERQYVTTIANKNAINAVGDFFFRHKKIELRQILVIHTHIIFAFENLRRRGAYKLSLYFFRDILRVGRPFRRPLWNITPERRP